MSGGTFAVAQGFNIIQVPKCMNAVGVYRNFFAAEERKQHAVAFQQIAWKNAKVIYAVYANLAIVSVIRSAIHFVTIYVVNVAGIRQQENASKQLFLFYLQ